MIAIQQKKKRQDTDECAWLRLPEKCQKMHTRQPAANKLKTGRG